MAISWVDNGTRVDGTNVIGTITLASGSGTAIGDTLLLACYNWANTQGLVSSISDDDANTWSDIRSLLSAWNSEWAASIWAANATATGAVNVTATMVDSTGNYYSSIVSTARGLGTDIATLEDVGDSQDANSGGGGGPLTATTATKTVDDCLVVALGGWDGDTSLHTITTGYTLVINGEGGTGSNICWSYKIESDSGTEAATFPDANAELAVLSCLKILATEEQAAFRYFDDDAAYASMTAETQDTDITAPVAENHILAVQVQAVNDPDTTQYQLEYRKNGDADSEWEALT